ncbi:MAG TPA: class I SAM-dependent methyltransferase [Gaiellaceae bacterium]|nr:class I SAM-dependent methyltransferase [Gaiellaceae bacterium]
MKMTRFEKQFVNGGRHSSRVAAEAERLVGAADPRPGQRLLDVGCGNGAAAVRLAAAYGLDVTGVDVDPEQIRSADASGAGRFLVADATRLPFADGEFDLVHTSKTTHHIRDWQRALAEMDRVLKPGGHLLYTDFVAPLGDRLPTRGALDRFAAEHGLATVRRSGSPVRRTVVLRKP